MEIDRGQIMNFHEKIIWQSLLYRIPLTIDPDAQVCVDQNDVTKMTDMLHLLCRLTGTRRMLHVEQDLLTLQKYLSSLPF